MFTGLIDDVGTIERVATGPAGRELRIRCRYDGLAEGESVAVNGACLTVRRAAPGCFDVAAIATTLDRTTIADWREGDRVNLERALRVGDRLGGHLVQGHVDGVATVRSLARREDALLVDLEIAADLESATVLHGSITVDGVSLTVNALPAPGVVQLSLVDYTLRHTTLGALTPGRRVHVEADLIGRYVARAVAHQLTGGAA